MAKIATLIENLLIVLLVVCMCGLAAVLIKIATTDEPEEPAVAVEYVTFNETRIIF